MIALTLAEIAQATAGSVINAGKQEIVIKNVSTDSRKIDSSCLFIALKGDKFDAHDFVKQVENAGVTSLIVHNKIATKLPYVLVENTHTALGLLGAFVKQKIAGLQCAAITGSNGKTTTKELLSEILRQYSKTENSVLATSGNFNNDIGLPLTLLRLTEENRFAVVELGANHAGEIAYTSKLAQPDVALINNVLPAHLEGFGSIEGVAKAKGEIWTSLSEQGYAVVNLDDDFALQYLDKLNKLSVNILTFSQHSQDANLFATELEFDGQGKASFTLNINIKNNSQQIHVSLNLPGKHNVSNALAASAMAIALGCNLEHIRQGLISVVPVAGRVNHFQASELINVIDDTYNANSASIKAAIDLLIQYDGEHLLILGDMGELGEHSEKEHIAVGKYAAEKGIAQLLTFGSATEKTSLAFNINKNKIAQHFTDKQQLAACLKTILLQNSKKLTILVKGSRSTKMEDIVAYIKQLQL